MAVKTIDINKLNEKVGSLYEAAVVIAKRARVLNERLGEMIKRELGEIENEEDFEDEKINKEDVIDKFDDLPKPCRTALTELLEDKLEFGYAEKVEEEKEPEPEE